ncbi:hypothetical protein AA416_05153 [Bacteroides cellulosilyticus]|nr:hypothetical protein AA416_05153 [Bacteroides cellulosilyticus]
MTSSRHYRTTKFIGKGKAPFSAGTLFAVLREDLMASTVIDVIDSITFRKFLVNVAVQEVIAVRITALPIRSSFRFSRFGVRNGRWVNTHQIVATVIFIMSEIGFGTIYMSRQDCTSQSVFKIISLISVFIRSTNAQ